MILASARQTAGESISTIASAKQTYSGSAQANGLTGGLDRNGETDCLTIVSRSITMVSW